MQSSVSDTCRQTTLCRALKDARGLGLGGRMLTVAISAVLGVFRQEREMPRSFDMLEQCEDKQGDDEICTPKEKHDTIQCGNC